MAGVFSLKATAYLLGVSESTLARMCRSGQLQTVKISARRRVVIISEIARVLGADKDEDVARRLNRSVQNWLRRESQHMRGEDESPITNGENAAMGELREWMDKAAESAQKVKELEARLANVSERLMCRHCGDYFAPRHGSGGKPQKYCSEDCRRRADIERKTERAEEMQREQRNIPQSRGPLVISGPSVAEERFTVILESIARGGFIIRGFGEGTNCEPLKAASSFADLVDYLALLSGIKTSR